MMIALGTDVVVTLKIRSIEYRVALDALFPKPLRNI